MPPTSDPACDPRHGAHAGSGYAVRRALRRRIRLVRRHLGPGPYLDFGCGRGDLLALLAAHGSVTGFEADAELADLARQAAPGCPVHTIPDAIPSGVFRGVLAPSRPDDATLTLWRRLLARGGGRVLMIGDGAIAPERLAAAGFALRWEGREHWRLGPSVVVLEARPRPGA